MQADENMLELPSLDHLEVVLVAASWRVIATMISFLRAPLIFSAVKADAHFAIAR